MAEGKLVQVYCTHCGDTRTFAKGDKRITARSCKVCLQGQIKPVVLNGSTERPVCDDAPTTATTASAEGGPATA